MEHFKKSEIVAKSQNRIIRINVYSGGIFNATKNTKTFRSESSTTNETATTSRQQQTTNQPTRKTTSNRHQQTTIEGENNPQK